VRQPDARQLATSDSWLDEFSFPLPPPFGAESLRNECAHDPNNPPVGANLSPKHYVVPSVRLEMAEAFALVHDHARQANGIARALPPALSHRTW
jgi:hypothetical protein